MKKLLLLSALALVATTANATEIKPYIEGKINQNWLKAEVEDDEMKFNDTVFGGALEIGAKINQFRVGLEGYYNNKMEDNIYGIIPIEGESQGFFLNGYWDIPSELKNIKPYISAGIGYSSLKATVKMNGFGFADESVKDEDLGYQLGLGIGYEINKNLDLSLGYRYENLGEITDINTTLTNHKVSLGLRYTF